MGKGEKSSSQEQNNDSAKKKEELLNFLRKVTSGEITYGMAEMLSKIIETIDKDPEHIKFLFLRRLLPPSFHVIPDTARVTKVTVISTEKDKSRIETARLSMTVPRTTVTVMLSYVDLNENKQDRICLRLEDNPDNDDSDSDALSVSIVSCDNVLKKEKQIVTGIIDDEINEIDEEVP